MKVEELFRPKHLQEGKWKQAIAAGALSAALAAHPYTIRSKPVPPEKVAYTAPVVVYPRPSINPEYKKTAEFIANTYNISDKFALKVVELAHKYANQTFPTAKDILAIAAIESSFNPKAISGLKSDPAIGLLQVRPKIWGIDPQKLEGSIGMQISTGAKILNLYYRKLHSKNAAIAAYNVGLGDFMSGNDASGYVNKFYHAVQYFNKGMQT